MKRESAKNGNSEVAPTVDDFVAVQSLWLQQGSTGFNKPTASA